MARRIFTKKKITQDIAGTELEAAQILRDKNIKFTEQTKEEDCIVFRYDKKKVAVWNRTTKNMEVIEYEV